MQKLFNKQAYSIIKMYLNILIIILMSKSKLILIYIIFYFWQCIYTYQLLSFSEFILIKNVFPITL